MLYPYVTNILIFQVNSHTFHDFSIAKVIFHDFPDLENFYFKFDDSQDFSRICMNPEYSYTMHILPTNYSYLNVIVEKIQYFQINHVRKCCRNIYRITTNKIR